MLRAVFLMIIGMSLIPLGDTAGKLLMENHSATPFFVAWTRFVLGALLLVPLLNRRYLQWRFATDWRLIFRGLLIAATIASILSAARTEPLADVFGAFFIAPIISFVLSVILLGERPTLPRVVLILVGFVGVLLIVKPGPSMSTGLLFAVLAGIFYGAFLTSSRWLADAAPPRALLFAQLVTGAIIMTPFGAAQIPEISPVVVGLIFWSAAASMGGNLLLILAYKLAPATRMAPFVYFQLVAATAFGWIFFADLPDALSWAGLGLLIASGFATLALRR